MDISVIKMHSFRPASLWNEKHMPDRNSRFKTSYAAAFAGVGADRMGRENRISSEKPADYGPGTNKPVQRPGSVGRTCGRKPDSRFAGERLLVFPVIAK